MSNPADMLTLAHYHGGADAMASDAPLSDELQDACKVLGIPVARIAILRQLSRAGGTSTTTELAAHCAEVPERTFYNNLKWLEDAGVLVPNAPAGSRHGPTATLWTVDQARVDAWAKSLQSALAVKKRTQRKN